MAVITSYVCDRCKEHYESESEIGHVMDLWKPSEKDRDVKTRYRYDLCSKCYDEIFGGLGETKNVMENVDIRVTVPQPQLNPNMPAPMPGQTVPVRRRPGRLDKSEWKVGENKLPKVMTPEEAQRA
jgi:hypothetical protein